MKENFGKEYKLCSKIVIEEVFKKGSRINQFPIQSIILETNLKKEIPFQILISVPKKKIKKSVTRNYVKRILRELIRKNKLHLESFLKEKQIQLAICVIYSTNEVLDYTELKLKIEKLFKKVQEHVSNSK